MITRISDVSSTSDLSDISRRELAMLPPRFVQVLLARKENMSYREIGATLGVGAERIRQIEAKALRKLRHPTRVRHLQGFLEMEEAA